MAKNGWREVFRFSFLLIFGQGTEWVERIFVIVLPRNFIGLFLVMAEWVNEDFFFGFCFSVEELNGQRKKVRIPLCFGWANDCVFSSGFGDFLEGLLEFLGGVYSKFSGCLRSYRMAENKKSVIMGRRRWRWLWRPYPYHKVEDENKWRKRKPRRLTFGKKEGQCLS
jgi:hypothetical protein